MGRKIIQLPFLSKSKVNWIILSQGHLVCLETDTQTSGLFAKLICMIGAKQTNWPKTLQESRQTDKRMID